MKGFNKQMAGFFLYILIFLFIPQLTAQEPMDFRPASETTAISAENLNNPDRIIYITDQWKFNEGDNLQWADPEYNDNDWETVSTFLSEFDMAFTEWEGYGWFRLQVQVDSTLVNEPLALLIESHYGASEIYFDGKKMFELGNFSTRAEQMQPYTDNMPRVLVFPDTDPHLIAVRFANFNPQPFLDMYGSAGFRFLLGEPEFHLNRQIASIYDGTRWQNLFLGGLLAFSLIHVLLFVFYPSEKRNLYFAIFTGFLALLMYMILMLNSSNSPPDVISYFKLANIVWVFTVVYALRFTYSLQDDHTPFQFWIFLAAGLVVILLTWVNRADIKVIRELFILASIIEMLRVLAKIFYKRRSGYWVIGFGLLFFALAVIYRISVNLDLMSGNVTMSNYWGAGVLILSMSVYLSRDFALTQKTLEMKLHEVSELSKKSLEQERINREIELESKLLEAENKRKSMELEEARALQLTMLPRKMPDHPDWDISVFMETAAEVGGDYYDYSLSKNGNLKLVLGDATGHGMKAGIMVATAKSYFHTLAGEHDNLNMLKRMSSGIKNMDLKKLFMGITLLECNSKHLNLSVAGMPPVLWYKQSDKKVCRITLKGLPLGSVIQYPYENREFEVQTGDVLLLMSDGLMELFNEDREMLGLERIENTLEEAGGYSAADIMNRLTGLIDKWSGTRGNEDDITLMVLKAR